MLHYFTLSHYVRTARSNSSCFPFLHHSWCRYSTWASILSTWKRELWLGAAGWLPNLPIGLSGPVYNDYLVDVLKYILEKLSPRAGTVQRRRYSSVETQHRSTTKTVRRSSQPPTKLILEALFFVVGYYSWPFILLCLLSKLITNGALNLWIHRF